MTEGFDSLNAAFKMREVVTRIAESVVNQMRPELRTASVVSTDRLNRRCTVTFVGETGEWTARYPKSEGPSVGDVVKVMIRNNQYWIAEVIETPQYGAVTTSERQIEPRLTGGKFGNTDLGVFFGFDSYNTPLAVGQCLYLGSFTNSASLFSKRALINFHWNEGMFANQFTTYSFFWQGDDPDAIWKVVLPQQVSGIEAANGHQLEARAINGQIEFRVRRKLDNGGTYSSIGMGGVQFFGNDIIRDPSVDWNYAYTDTEPTAVFGDIPGGNLENNSSSTFIKGPYYDSEKYSIQDRVQQNLTGGGIITWDGQYLSWSQPFRAHLGSNPFSSQGYIDIASPATGVTINHHGAFISNQAVASNLINMKAGGETRSTLYYDPPLRGTGAADTSRFHLIGGSSNPFNVPSHWIMIATMDSRGSGNNGIPSLRLGTGREVDHWRSLSYSNGWSDFGGGYPGAEFKLEHGIVHLRGLVDGGTTGATIATLPAGYRPEFNSLHVGIDAVQTTSAGALVRDYGARIQVNNSGTIAISNLSSGTVSNAYVGLFGISFPAGA